jgi:crotonobetainyl-CoA:carnitine CoA-transferase CaiB-like acyl-CoA transferase
VTTELRPLHGIRVVNFGVGGVAPWAASQLAQLGATVIKIEAPNEFIMYTMPPWRGLTTTYAALNANCRSVKLDLKNEGDRLLAWRIAETADVLIENFRSGAIDRMGFGFDVVSKQNPRIVFCSSSGFGREGDMAGLPCTDPHIQAFSGFATLNDAEPPGERVRYYGMIDLYTGQLIAEAVLAGLIARNREGAPQYIEMTMLGAASSLLMTRLAEHLRGGPAPTSRTRHTAPDDLYATADGTVALTIENDADFRALCGVLKRDDLAKDRRFATASARLAAIEALNAELQLTFATAPTDWWMVALRQAGIASARVHADHEASAHRETWQRGHLREIAVGAGMLLAAAPVWDFENVAPLAGIAPQPGQDTALLRENADKLWQVLEVER